MQERQGTVPCLDGNLVDLSNHCAVGNTISQQKGALMKTFLKTLIALTLATAFLLTGCDTTDVSSNISSKASDTSNTDSSESSQNHVETTNFLDIDLSAYEGMSLDSVAWIDNDNFVLLLYDDSSAIFLRCCVPEKRITTLFEADDRISSAQNFKRNGKLYFVAKDFVLQIDTETLNCKPIPDESVSKNYLAHISSRGTAVYKNENDELVMFDFLDPENTTLLLDRNGDPIEVKSKYTFSLGSFGEKLWSASGNYFLYRKNQSYYIFDAFGNLCSVSDVVSGSAYEQPLYDSFLYGYTVEIFPDGTQSKEKYFNDFFPVNGAVFAGNQYYITLLDRDTQELRLVCYTDGEETGATTVDYTKRYNEISGDLIWDRSRVIASPDQTRAIMFFRGVGLICGVVEIE